MIIEQDPNAAKVASDTASTGDTRRWLGKSVNRVEDPRFLRGEGRYIDDIKLPGMTHAAIVRSPHAHARIVAIRTEAAERLPGVIRVVTGRDVAEHASPLPSFGAGPIVQDMIAIEKVRHYGETVAAVIAENRYIAEDACDLIEVDYELLPVVLDPFEARAEGSALVHEKLGTNVAYERTFSFGEVDRAFAEAEHTVQAQPALAALDGHADGHERRDRRLRPRHGRDLDLRELDELHVLPVADRRLAAGAREQAPAGAGRRRAAASARSSSCTRCRRSQASSRCSSDDRSSTSRIA